jgi:hypothetical protein
MNNIHVDVVGITANVGHVFSYVFTKPHSSHSFSLLYKFNEHF